MFWKKSDSRQRMAAVIVAVGGAFLILSWASRQTPSLATSGVQYAEAFERCDGQTLYNLTFDEELKANHLTPAKMTEVCKAVVLPSFEHFKKDRRLEVHKDDQPSVIVDRIALDSFGRRSKWNVQVYQTPNGPKGEFMARVFYAYYSEVAAEQGHVRLDKILFAKSTIECWNRHKELFDRLDVKYRAFADNQKGNVRLVRLTDSIERDLALVSGSN